MRYGAMNFPVVPILEEIETFAALNFDYLELTMDPPEAHHSAVAKNISAISRELQRYEMGIVCHMPTFVSPADLTDSIRQASVQEMSSSLSVAADLGAKKVVLHPPAITGMGNFVPETAKRYAYDFFSEIVGLSGTLGVTICLENMMPGYGFGVDVEELSVIFKTFPQLKFTLDTGHAHLHAGTNRLRTLVSLFGDRIGHIHLSDNRGVRDDHSPLGTGTINFKQLSKDLAKIGYDDTVTFEVFDSDLQKLSASRTYWHRLVERAFGNKR